MKNNVKSKDAATYRHTASIAHYNFKMHMLQTGIFLYTVCSDRHTIPVMVIMAMAIIIILITIATNYDHHKDLYPPLNHMTHPYGAVPMQDMSPYL